MVVRSRTSRIAHVLERVGLAMMGASRGLFVAVLLAKVGIEVLTFPVVTFAIMIYGAIGFYLGIDLPSEASYRSQANGSLDESIPRIKWIERLSGAGTFFAALAAFVSVRNIVVDGDPRGLWTLVVGCGWLVGVTMQIIAGANCAPGPEFVRRLVRFSKQRSHVRIVCRVRQKSVGRTCRDCGGSIDQTGFLSLLFAAAYPSRPGRNVERA